MNSEDADRVGDLADHRKLIPLSAVVGRRVTIPIIVRNNGPGAQIGTHLTVKLPRGLLLVSCPEFGSRLRSNYRPLPPLAERPRAWR